jgi:hypothetical protein
VYVTRECYAYGNDYKEQSVDSEMDYRKIQAVQGLSNLTFEVRIYTIYVCVPVLVTSILFDLWHKVVKMFRYHHVQTGLYLTSLFLKLQQPSFSSVRHNVTVSRMTWGPAGGATQD